MSKRQERRYDFDQSFHDDISVFENFLKQINEIDNFPYVYANYGKKKKKTVIFKVALQAHFLE